MFSAAVGLFFGLYPAMRASPTRSGRGAAVRVAATARASALEGTPMNVRESASIALLALRANKLRSFLTLLGVIIRCVVGDRGDVARPGARPLRLGPAGDGGIERVQRRQDRRRASISPRSPQRNRRRDLTVEDADAIRRAARHVDAVVAGRSTIVTVRRGHKSARPRPAPRPRGRLHGGQRPAGRTRPRAGAERPADARLGVRHPGWDVADQLSRHASTRSTARSGSATSGSSWSASASARARRSAPARTST